MTSKVAITLESKDKVKYHLTVVEDIITLEPEQIEAIKNEIAKSDSCSIEERGISLDLYRTHQKQAVMDALSGVLQGLEVEEIHDLQLVTPTEHAEKDRMDDEVICLQRNWDPERVMYQVIHCLKRAFNVDQVRIRFDDETKESLPNFAFRVKGFKSEKDEGRVVIYFKDDIIEMDKTIRVITILPAEF